MKFAIAFLSMIGLYLLLGYWYRYLGGVIFHLDSIGLAFSLYSALLVSGIVAILVFLFK